MNTIKLTYEELNNISKYSFDKYFDEFIFYEYRIIIKYEDYKVIYKVNYENDVNKVTYRIIKGTNFKDFEFSFIEDREHLVCIDSNGKTMGGNIYEGETIVEKLSQDGDIKINKLIVTIASTIRMIKQYIMNESYKRKIIQKEVETRNYESEKTNKKNNSKSNTTGIYLLKDIITYVSNSKPGNNITCECWSVRGHFRHYKNGNVTWISSYEKGSKRNSGVGVKDKVYKI